MGVVRIGIGLGGKTRTPLLCVFDPRLSSLSLFCAHVGGTIQCSPSNDFTRMARRAHAISRFSQSSFHPPFVLRSAFFCLVCFALVSFASASRRLSMNVLAQWQHGCCQMQHSSQSINPRCHFIRRHRFRAKTLVLLCNERTRSVGGCGQVGGGLCLE
jgi:hypothetical protein